MTSENGFHFFTFCAFGKLIALRGGKSPCQEAKDSIQCHCFALLRWWGSKITLQRNSRVAKVSAMKGL